MAGTDAGSGSGRGRMRDFTRGSIVGHLVAFSLPMLAGNLLQSMYNVVDSIWVGRYLGPEALAAVSTSFPFLFALVALVMGMGMAASTMVAQYTGAGEPEKVQKTIVICMIGLGLSGIVLTVVGYFVRYPVLTLLNTPVEIIHLAADYLGVFLLGLVFMFIYNISGAILRGVGDSRTPLMLLVWSTAINVVLDPFLILGLGPFPALGVKGAALATVISQTIAAVMGISYLARHTQLVKWDVRAWGFDWALMRVMMRIGLPSGIQQTFVSLGLLAVNRVVNGFGPVIVAAFGTGMRVDQFAFLPAMTLALAMSAMVGQNLGAGEEGRVRSIVRWTMGISVGLALVCSIIIAAVPRALLSVFTTDTGVLDAGAVMLKIMAFSYVPFAAMFTFVGVLRGAGDTIPTMISTILTLWVIRIPLASYLSSLPELGERGIWMSMVVSASAGMIINWIYYVTGRWKKMKVAGPATFVSDPGSPAQSD